MPGIFGGQISAVAVGPVGAVKSWRMGQFSACSGPLITFMYPQI